jgi:hypothetical protein
MRSARGLVSALAVAALLGGVLVSRSWAGGPPVELAATGGRVWVTTGTGVAELDAFSGKVMRTIRARYPFTIRVGVSVENGFVSGAVTRVPFEERRRATSPVVMPRRPVLDLAVGSGVTWALAGPWERLRLLAIDQATGRSRSVPIRHDLGWIAADNTGATPGLFGMAGNRVVRVRPDGTTRTLGWLRPVGRPVVALGSLWVPTPTQLVRLDPVTGRVEGSVAMPMAGSELAVGGSAVWMLRLRGTPSPPLYDVIEIDPKAMRVVERRRLPGRFSGIAYENGAVWVGTIEGDSVLRLDQRTLDWDTFRTSR